MNNASNVVKLHPEQTSNLSDFAQAWGLLPATMRRRSKPILVCEKAWIAKERHCGPGRLLPGLRAFLAKDPDIKRTGGCGFHLWIRDKADHWLPLEAVDISPRRQLIAPNGYRERFVTLLGEDFVASWIDRCTWRAGQLWHPLSIGVDRLDREFRSRQIKVRVGLDRNP